MAMAAAGMDWSEGTPSWLLGVSCRVPKLKMGKVLGQHISGPGKATEQWERMQHVTLWVGTQSSEQAWVPPLYATDGNR